MCASMNGHHNSVYTLIDKGADINAKSNVSEHTIQHVIMQWGLVI